MNQNYTADRKALERALQAYYVHIENYLKVIGLNIFIIAQNER